MLDGLGLTGYEGVFRSVAEATMGVLRTNRDMLMSVLESFVHDPLVEWSKSARRRRTQQADAHGEEENEDARSMVDRINERLQVRDVGGVRDQHPRVMLPWLTSG